MIPRRPDEYAAVAIALPLVTLTVVGLVLIRLGARLGRALDDIDWSDLGDS